MPGVVLAHRIPPELFKLYVERRYADVDPVMRMLRRTTEPFKGTSKNSAVRQFVRI
jgi:hypothetical protein